MERITLISLLSPVIALVFAPIVPGIIAKTKAFFAGRRGPPLLQVYFDIWKLLHKGAVYSTTTSWVFKAGPIVSLGAVVTACLIVPFGPLGAPLSFTGDLLLFMYLLGIMRFFTVVAALDTGSAFEGMGASREVFFSALAEPVFLLCILSLARSAQNFRFFEVFGGAPPFSLVPALLAGASLFAVMLAENARIPFDDPATHLELTMIHEVMVLDHSGPDFAFINYASSCKLWLFGLIVVRTLLPVRSTSPVVDILFTAIGMVMVGIAIGAVESVMARLKLLRVPQLLAGAAALALLALLAGEGVVL
jgi:formate hydrogenlyase subunit 4